MTDAKWRSRKTVSVIDQSDEMNKYLLVTELADAILTCVIVFINIEHVTKIDIQVMSRVNVYACMY